MPKHVPDFDLPSPSSESESHESVSEQEYDDDGSQGPSPSQYEQQLLKEMSEQVDEENESDELLDLESES